mgnify:CR=1 FL=1
MSTHLVTGSNGFIGSFIIKELIAKGENVIGIDLTNNQNNFVQGYKNVIFSGITVLELARLIDTYIIPRRDIKGILNISGESISKFDLLKILAHVYNKSIEIIPSESMKINRTLNGSQFNKLTGYKINSWPLLIRSMYEFNLLNK